MGNKSMCVGEWVGYLELLQKCLCSLEEVGKSEQVIGHFFIQGIQSKFKNSSAILILSTTAEMRPTLFSSTRA